LCLILVSLKGFVEKLHELRSTAEFMKLFYEALKADKNKAQAVQEAMAEIRRRYAHPYYWAPFVLVGKYL